MHTRQERAGAFGHSRKVWPFCPHPSRLHPSTFVRQSRVKWPTRLHNPQTNFFSKSPFSFSRLPFCDDERLVELPFDEWVEEDDELEAEGDAWEEDDEPPGLCCLPRCDLAACLRGALLTGTPSDISRRFAAGAGAADDDDLTCCRDCLCCCCCC